MVNSILTVFVVVFFFGILNRKLVGVHIYIYILRLSIVKHLYSLDWATVCGGRGCTYMIYHMIYHMISPCSSCLVSLAGLAGDLVT